MGCENDVVVENTEVAVEHLTKYALSKSGMAYAFVTDNNGVLTVHERWNQPCYGEMRPYGRTHPDLLPEHQRSVGKPGDLNTPFPKEGSPIMVVLCMYQQISGWSKKAQEGFEDFLKFFMDPERSPWRTATKEAEVIRNPDGVCVGILFNDTKIMPTLLIEGWMFLRSRMTTKNFEFWADLRETLPNEDLGKLCLFWYGMYSWDGASYYSNWGAYYLSNKVNLERFLSGSPIIDGPTLFERGAYNRPKLHDVFGNDGKDVAKILRDAGASPSKPLPRKDLVELFPKFVSALDAAA